MGFAVGTGKEARESELPALEQLVAMGYEYKTKAELNSTRTRYSEVLLYDRLREAVRRLNSELDADGVQDAVSQMSEDRFAHGLPVVDTNEKIRAKLIGLSQTGGLEPIIVSQNSEVKTVKIFDFENVENNDFLVTNQFQIQGFKNPIFPDIVIFVNGIPLVIMECKDPTVPRPIEQAYEKNFARYQRQGAGFEKLFFYNHAMIATCGIVAKVGTLRSDLNHYARWSGAYPYSTEEVKAMCGGRVREQEMVIAGLLSKRNILDHLQNFVIYETINGQKVKKIAKHQQFRTVSKATDRLKTTEIKDKGGVIWHTQGSGKSLSMLWLVSKIMREHHNPGMVIITDRKQLDKQIHETFKNGGFPNPIKAGSGEHLRRLLANPRGRTIMTTIDKFSTDSKVHTDEKIICLVDEAHRSHFQIKAVHMRAAMPEAVFFGFSGTPIDKKDKSVYGVFGPLLDKYGFEESQADGSTIPIYYEGRLPGLAVDGDDTIEHLYDRVIRKDPSIDSKLAETLKRKYVTREKIAEAPSRIRRIARDIAEHYESCIEPNGYKAMLVAGSREAAVAYKRELDAIRAPASKIIMTSNLGETGNDGKSWDEFYLEPKQRAQEAERFKSAANQTKILIVVDMLLVGYDAPICQVMYLDRGLKEHTLLQAIARVNRPYDEAKTHGLVVDYFGVTQDLKKAFLMFEQDDITGALKPVDDMLRPLRDRHADVMKHFEGMARDNDTIIERFESSNLREALERDFKTFSSALDAVMPDKAADQYITDFKFVSGARHLLRTLYGDDLAHTGSYSQKIQKLINDHIRSIGVSSLFYQEITRENFLAVVDKISSLRAQAALVKSRAIAIIDELSPRNPAFYESLRNRLQRIIDEEEERRKKNTIYFTDPEQYITIYQEALSEESKRTAIFGTYQANQFEFAVYGELRTKSQDEAMDLAKEIYAKIKPETEIIEWNQKIGVEKSIRAALYSVLSKAKFDDQEIDLMSDKIIQLARNDL